MLHMINCLLLSAGLSERFGSPKALAPIAGKTAIEQVQLALLQSSCAKIIIVLGAHADKIHPYIFIHNRIYVVYNKNYYFGQTSSVQVGLKQAENSNGIMLWPVDCPFIQSSTVDQAIDQFEKNGPDILIPTYQGKKGHPPIFNQRLKTKILDLPTGSGLNSIFTAHPPQTIEINDSGIIKSFNTPEEFKKLINN